MMGDGALAMITSPGVCQVSGTLPLTSNPYRFSAGDLSDAIILLPRVCLNQMIPAVCGRHHACRTTHCRSRNLALSVPMIGGQVLIELAIGRTATRVDHRRVVGQALQKVVGEPQDSPADAHSVLRVGRVCRLYVDD